ncbi:MAG: 2-succinylbenzoate-CoA ligase [Candidatus Nephthysia bennettiae]|nr:MAG: 2-succinylbenzoate-CoA ligase [Candidatus Dormibacteraeota bacterium]
MVSMVSDPLRELAVRQGPRRALFDRSAGFWVSWFDLDGLAHAWARRLGSAGVQPGDRVAVQEPAGVRFAALLHGCLRVGAALVPLSPRAIEPELRRVLDDSRPRLLVRDGEVEALEAPAPGDPGDACVVYTSGTTGNPKGVRLTFANHVASALGCAQMLGASDRDRWLLVLPPHHVAGLAVFMRSVISGQPMVTLDRFQEQPVLEALEIDRPTLVSLVPTMLVRLLGAGGLEQLRGPRAILLGGAPVSASQVVEWTELGLKVCPSYGLTESCSQVAVVPPGRALELAGTCGPVGPQASVEILAMDPSGGDGSGEIVLSGPAVSPGYVNAGLSSAPSGGSFATGDLGRLEGGVLTVLGRSDDTIITGGEKVRPEEVQAVLEAHPGVREAAVAGRPDETWGEIVGAWVVADAAIETELDRWCRQRLPSHKVPRRWQFVPALPRSEGGKLLRRQLELTEEL